MVQTPYFESAIRGLFHLVLLYDIIPVVMLFVVYSIAWGIFSPVFHQLKIFLPLSPPPLVRNSCEAKFVVRFGLLTQQALRIPARQGSVGYGVVQLVSCFPVWMFPEVFIAWYSQCPNSGHHSVSSSLVIYLDIR